MSGQDYNSNHGGYPTPSRIASYNDQRRHRGDLRPYVLIDRRKDIPIPCALLSGMSHFRGPTFKVLVYLFAYTYGLGLPERFLSLDEFRTGALRTSLVHSGDGSVSSDIAEDSGVGLESSVLIASLTRLETDRVILGKPFVIDSIQTVYGINWNVWSPIVSAA